MSEPQMKMKSTEGKHPEQHPEITENLPTPTAHHICGIKWLQTSQEEVLCNFVCRDITPMLLNQSNWVVSYLRKVSTFSQM
jgi:hypothetical protein